MKRLLYCIDLFSLICNAPFALAQSTNPNLTPDQERVLREELAQIETQIKQQQVILDQKQGEATAYQSDIK